MADRIHHGSLSELIVQVLDRAVLPGEPLGIDEQAEALVEGERGVVSVSLLLLPGGRHGMEAKRRELLERGALERGRSSSAIVVTHARRGRRAGSSPGRASGRACFRSTSGAETTGLYSVATLPDRPTRCRLACSRSPIYLFTAPIQVFTMPIRPFTMARSCRSRWPDLAVHDDPIYVFTIVRNTQSGELHDA